MDSVKDETPRDCDRRRRAGSVSDRSSRGRGAWAVLFLCALGAVDGCAGKDSASSYPYVADHLFERTGHEAAAEASCPDCAPPAVDWEDGLSEEEAVALALWNNAAFREVLADLGIARGDLIHAGLLPNPELWLLSPYGPKQLEYALEFSVDSLWLRAKRVAVAQRESERVAETLVQAGLNLVRDVRAAYADVLLARERQAVANEALRLRGRLYELANLRLRAGDATPLEVATTHIDALRAREEMLRIAPDIALAEERLRNLLSIGLDRMPLLLSEPRPLPDVCADPQPLVDEALATRPDALAAQSAAAAAAERLRLAHCDFIRFFGIIDANGRGTKGHEIGPGFRLTLPIFNWNEGRIARAQAELERAVRAQATVRDRIILEVRQAHLQFTQARNDLAQWETQIRPAVEKAVRTAEKAYRQGDASPFLVLENARQLIETRFREVQLEADLRRALAELERSVGRRLDAVPAGVGQAFQPDGQAGKSDLRPHAGPEVIPVMLLVGQAFQPDRQAGKPDLREEPRPAAEVPNR